MLGRDTQLSLQGIVPQLFHIVPVYDLSLSDRSRDLEDATFLISLITHVDVVIVESDHDLRYFGPADSRGEDRTWGIVSSKASFALTGAIINDYNRYFFFHYFFFFNLKFI